MFKAQVANNLAPVFQDKVDTKECGNYKGVKLMNHIMKLWERLMVQCPRHK